MNRNERALEIAYADGWVYDKYLYIYTNDGDSSTEEGLVETFSSFDGLMQVVCEIQKEK